MQVAFVFESGEWQPQDCLPFLMIGEEGTSGSLGGVRALPISRAKSDTAFDLVLLMAASHDRMTGALHYNKSLYVASSASCEVSTPARTQTCLHLAHTRLCPALRATGLHMTRWCA